MPLPVEGLTPESSPISVRDAIKNSIAQCIKEGKDPKQCAAIAYQYARDKTGKDIGKEA